MLTKIDIEKPYRGATPDPVAATKDAMVVSKQGLIPLVEVFYSLQGEGLRTGQATVFVRVAGCNCDCWFCDTDFRVREVKTVAQTVENIQQIGGDCRWVCLTGGEPTIHDLLPLCDNLHRLGYQIQIETNGSKPRPGWNLDHVTVSPKVRQGATLAPSYLSTATEFKHVIDDHQDLENAITLAQQHTRTIFLQPNALNPLAVGLCIDAIKLNPQRFRLSLQTHKLLDIR